MSMGKVAYCGILQHTLMGETIDNILCIEFHSDDTTELSNHEYLGFDITYHQRKGSVQIIFG